MGSGLIWAGIGKGIADAGTTFGTMGFKAAEAELAEQRALQRGEALERLKLKLEEERAARDAETAVKIEQRATQMGQQREAAQLGRDTAKLGAIAQDVGGASPAMTEAEISKLMEENPQYRETYRKAGLIDAAASRGQRQLQQADDQIQAAREMGASANLLKSYIDTKRTVLEQIREENRERRDEQRHFEVLAQQEASDRRFAALLPIQQQKADAATARAGRGSSGGEDGAAKVRSTKTDSEGNVIAVMSDGSTQPLGIKSAEFNAKLASLITTMSKNDYKFSKLPEEEKRQIALQRLTGAPSSAPAASAPARSGSSLNSLPAGATQIGTSGGKPVYQLPDGRRFIQK